MGAISSGLRNRIALVALYFAFGLASSILIGNEAADAQGLPGGTCSAAVHPATSTIYFPKYGGSTEIDEVQRYGRYDHGTAAHTLIVMGSNNLLWDGEPTSLGLIETRLRESTSKGEHDFAVAVLIQPNLDFAVVEKVMQTFNKIGFCDFSIRNTGLFGAFGKQKSIEVRKLRPVPLADFSSYPIVIAISTDRQILAPRTKRPGAQRQDACAIFYGNTYVDSAELSLLLNRDVVELASGAQRPRVLAKVTRGTPWRCVAGVISRIFPGGIEAVDVQLVPN